MWRNRPRISWGSRLAALWLAGAITLFASEQRGQVLFNGLPVPGATVIAVQGTTSLTHTTDSQGVYVFADLADGVWAIEIEMVGFAPVKRDVTVAPNAPAATWNLSLLPLNQIPAQAPAIPTQPAAPAPQAVQEQAQAPQRQQETQPVTAEPNNALDQPDGLLINGSVNNGAASPFSQFPAFGNARTGGNNLYNGGIGFTFDNSALDARTFSVTGQNEPKPDYNRMTGLLTFGGPFKIPRLVNSGPFVFVAYQWTRNRSESIQPALVPTVAERSGDFSQLATPLIDPSTGLPYPANRIPANRLSPQAEALLRLYPLPNFSGSSGYNYQTPILSAIHQDSLESRALKSIGNKDQLNGRFAFQSTRGDDPSLFGFLDTKDTLGINSSVNWFHRFTQHTFLNLGYQFSRFSTDITPYFENRENVSGLAGISGNSQDARDWGPPTLNFSSGIYPLSDANSAFNRNQTGAVSYSLLWNHGVHNFEIGGDFRREEFNYLSQQNPRGTFQFTGAATGSDFADFLLGIPDASSIAFGNADKYFRESVYDDYVNDDWRIRPGLTLNAGLRWEYGAPITELYNRLVNLDITPGFRAAEPVVASDPIGPATGEHYPQSLVRPDKSGLAPRVGVAWRPISGSSLVVRGGYGIYYDTSVYQTIALQMAQQGPLSKSLSIQNTAANPLTLAHGFNSSNLAVPDTFAVDPNLRVGYAQNWQASIQADLPASLQMTATYLGIKGTHGLQDVLPNTYPVGAVNPCPACPIGFAYLSSGGNSTREAAELQLRRRARNGFAAVLQYTFSKAIDDDAALGGQGDSATGQNTAQAEPSVAGGAFSSARAPTGSEGLAIAQNWMNRAAERSLSSFDQRHALTLQMQYTSGMGLYGGALLRGWKGALLKEWTFAGVVTAASGFPETPIYFDIVPGTAVTGSIRPNYTGQPLYAAPPGLFLNPAAFAAPYPGEWGNAGRNSITGPAQFTLDASLGRTFRLRDRLNLDLRFDSTNALNHVNFTAWNTTINSPQFGLPQAANGMRSLQTTVRLRF